MRIIFAENLRKKLRIIQTSAEEQSQIYYQFKNKCM